MHRSSNGSAGTIAFVPEEPRPASSDDRRATAAVERFLSAGAATPDLEVLQRHRLVAYAAARAPDGATLPGGREAILHATAVHLQRKAALLPLVRAWRAAGIDVLAVKGFHLAEYVHASPAERPAHDVDLVVPEEHAAAAVAIAERCGWSAHRRREDSLTNPHSHTSATLWREGVVVEVHRFVVHASTRRAPVQRRLTAAAWRAARRVPFGDVDLHVPDPRDALIFGIVLNRAWSDDAWHLTARDYLDMRALADRDGITRDEVLHRAGELGCRSTVALVLERCDPWRSRLDLEPPTWARRQAWSLRVAHERGLLVVEQSLAATYGWTSFASPQLLRALRVRRLLRGDGDVAAHLARWAPRAPVAGATERAIQRAIQASIWAARIVGPVGDRSRLRSIVLFEALRDLGVPATLYLATGHPAAPAWVQLDDRPPPLGLVGRSWDLPFVAIRHGGAPPPPSGPDLAPPRRPAGARVGAR